MDRNYRFFLAFNVLYIQLFNVHVTHKDGMSCTLRSYQFISQNCMLYEPDPRVWTEK